MATRSDFAQKLLNDLRMRKERMAVSQSSSHSTRMAGDACGNSKHNCKGSRQMKSSEFVSSRPANSHRRSGSSTRSLNIEETSRQLVPYRGQNPEKIGDMSMALTFALENSGKLNKLDTSGNNPMLSFLHHISGRSLAMEKMERSSSFVMNRSSSRFPTLSHLHIKEISKGAQKLNEILRACSNGLNFEGYSIEIGKELLKGAMDLEQSLRMLVNLQEASEYMVTPQRKNKIRLLEEEDEDEDSTVKTAEQKQIARPRFSFDKPLRSSQCIKGVTKTDLKQQSPMVLTYSSKAPNFPRKQAISTSDLVHHKRSASCGPDFRDLAAFSELKQSKTENGRMSNVIAKLMGLEELPHNVNSKSMVKESSSKQKEGMISKKITHASTKNAETKTTAEILALPAIQKNMIQTNKILLPQDIQTTRKANSQTMVPAEKIIGKDSERADAINLVAGSRKASITLDKQQGNIGQFHFTSSQHTFQEKARRRVSTYKEHVDLEKGKTKQLVLDNEVQKHKSREVANMPREKIWGKESALQKEKRNPNNLSPINQQKLQYDHDMNQQQIFQDLQEVKSEAQKREQKPVRQNFHVREQKRVEVEAKNSLKPTHNTTGLQKKQKHMNQTVPYERSSSEIGDERPLKALPNSKHQGYHIRDGRSAKLEVNTRNMANGKSDKNAFPAEVRSETNNTKGSIPPDAEEKLVHVPTTRKKVDHMKIRASETPRKIEVVLTRRNENRHNSARPLNQQTSILQELKQRRLEKFSGIHETDQTSEILKAVQNVRGKKSEASINLQNGALPSNKEAQVAPSLSTSGDDERQDTRIPCSPFPNETCQDIDLEPSLFGIQETEQTSEILKEAVQNVRGKKSEASSNLQNGAMPSNKKAQVSPSLSSSGDNERQDTSIKCLPTPNETCQHIASEPSTMPIDSQDQTPAFSMDQELKSPEIASSPFYVADEGSTEISYHSKYEHRENSIPGMQELLTENETQLKQIVIRSQLFLNKAEGLFHLNIPLGIHDVSDYNSQDADSKLMLDCGFEIMKRKGRRLELTLLSCLNISMSPIRLTSLDDLVKKLCKDFEKLQFYCSNGSDEYEVADYLQKMLERDVQNRDPDVNGVWDLGWNEMMFAALEKDDLIRDVERFLLNGLLDEVLKDLLHLSVSV